MNSSVWIVGREQSPVICVDDFSADPESLITAASEAAYISVGPTYPGVRAPAPQTYTTALLARLAPLIEQTFGAPPADDLDLCAFSIVTAPRKRLKPLQRLPHFDGPEFGRLAFLHYLCQPRQGGTSFYRHRSTGFECVTPDRLDAYTRTMLKEIEAVSPAVGYIAGDSPLFERIHSVDARFNRLIIYKGNALHSGDIAAEAVLIEDARRGRLTINGFGWLQQVE